MHDCNSFCNNTIDFVLQSVSLTQNITTTAQGEQLYNILFIEKAFGLELPKWTEDVYPTKLLVLAERNLALLTENDYMKRVRGGKIIFEIFNILQMSH